MNAASQPTPPRAPLALAAIAVACGIFLAQHIQRSLPQWGWPSALLIVCTLIAIYHHKLALARVSISLALVCAGAFAQSATPTRQIHTPSADFLSGERVFITGYVTNDGSLLAGGSRERFDLQAETIEVDSRTFNQPTGIRISVFVRGGSFTPDVSGHDEEERRDAPAQFPQLNYGDRVSLTAKLRPPRNFRNPGAFDYEGYLRGLGISALGSADADTITVLPGRSGSALGRMRSRIRRSILNHINSKTPGLATSPIWQPEDAALFAAMIVGDDSLIRRNVREEFQETGVYHLLVVSGMNVGILAFAVFFLARGLRVPEWGASLLTIGLAAFYAFIVGAGIPIQRAVLMLSVFLVARLFYRDRAALNATGVAALAVLIWSPSALFEAGFQLTFLALLAITGIGLPLLERTSNHYRVALANFDSTAYDLNIDPTIAQLRLDLRLIIARLARFTGKFAAQWLVLGMVQTSLAAFELVVVSTIMQAVLVAPMRAYFHRATLIGMPANILVLPLAGVMLNAGVLAIALSYVFTPLARAAGLVASACLHWTLACLSWLSHFPVTQWRTPDLNTWLWMVSAASILAAYMAARQTRKIVTAGGMAILFASALFVAITVPKPDIRPGTLEITAIDVGQGDSLLVVSPQGKTMLIDGGGSVGPLHGEFDYGEDVVSPYLWSRGIDHLDVVALTHAHGDHIGGLPRIVENFSPRELWLGINPETPALKKLRDAAGLRHVAVQKHVQGDHFSWGGTDIRVLSPPADWQPATQPRNDDSLTLWISFGHTSALLTGDLERRMEKFVAAETVGADLLKVAHHGSATSTTPELLAAVQPKYAVISDGFRNPFGHPRSVVLERLQGAHVRTYRTDMLGVVSFWLDGKQVIAQPASFPAPEAAALMHASTP